MKTPNSKSLSQLFGCGVNKAENKYNINIITMDQLFLNYMYFIGKAEKIVGKKLTLYRLRDRDNILKS